MDPYRMMTSRSEYRLVLPEFLARVDEIIQFRSLTVEDFKKIAVLMLQEYVGSLKEKGISFTWDDKAVSWLAEHAFGKRSGARTSSTPASTPAASQSVL